MQGAAAGQRGRAPAMRAVVALVAAALVAAAAQAAAPRAEAALTITTAAGTGKAGFGGDGGPAASAKLDLPRAVEAIPGGGYLIADLGNSRVRRVDAAGTIATIAGDGTAGFAGDGGAATAARIDFLHATAPTPDGGVLISDTRNQRVRRVAPDGTITTVAGSGPFGSFGAGSFAGDGGAATAARLYNPHGIAVAADGSVLIADTDNERVRMVTPGADGVVDGDADDLITTVAGTGAAGFSGDGGAAKEARLRSPFDVSPTADGGFLVADTGNDAIRAVDPAGKIATVAGQAGVEGFGGDGGPATAATLSAPHSVAATPEGGYLIADKNNNRIREVTSAGTIATVAGSGPTGADTGGFGGDEGPPTEALLDQPKDAAPLGGGAFLISDGNNQRIRLVDDRPVPPLAVALTKARYKLRWGRTIRLRYTSTVPARVTLKVKRRGRRVLRRRGRSDAGRNLIILPRGKVRRKLDPRRYRLVLEARSGAERDRDRARLRLRPRR